MVALGTAHAHGLAAAWEVQTPMAHQQASLASCVGPCADTVMGANSSYMTLWYGHGVPFLLLKAAAPSVSAFPAAQVQAYLLRAALRLLLLLLPALEPAPLPLVPVDGALQRPHPERLVCHTLHHGTACQSLHAAGPDCTRPAVAVCCANECGVVIAWIHVLRSPTCPVVLRSKLDSKSARS